MGAKTKYTKALHTAIIRNLEAGCFRKHACEAVGISNEAMEEWIDKGDAGIEPYVKFAEDVHAAQAKDAVRNQLAITRAAMGEHAGDWKAAAWNLEKKFPKLYGKHAELKALIDLERPRSPWKPGPDAVAQPVVRKLDS